MPYRAQVDKLLRQNRCADAEQLTRRTIALYLEVNILPDALFEEYIYTKRSQFLKIYNPDHIDSLIARFVLATVLFRRLKVEEAEATLTEALVIYRSVRG